MVDRDDAPASLKPRGAALWRVIQDEYMIEDGASLAILESMCQAVDRIQQCQEAIDRDGMVVTGSTGQPQQHPLLKTEAEARRALLAHARALKLDLAGVTD